MSDSAFRTENRKRVQAALDKLRNVHPDAVNREEWKQISEAIQALKNVTWITN